MKDKFVFYIHSDILNEDRFNDSNFKSHIQCISSLLDVARFLKSNVFYSLLDINTLQEVLNLDEYFTQSQANILDVLLKDFIVNKEVHHLFKVHFSEENTCLEPCNFNICNSTKDKTTILLTLDKEEELYLLKVKSNNDFEQIAIQSVFNKENLWAIINKQISRNYNFTSKHGDSNTNAMPPTNKTVSQLLTSDVETQELLDNAIFDLRQSDWCYNFDKNKNTYIVFPFEGVTPQNNYHAFHILEAEWGQEIPNSIRKYFNK